MYYIEICTSYIHRYIYLFTYLFVYSCIHLFITIYLYMHISDIFTCFHLKLKHVKISLIDIDRFLSVDQYSPAKWPWFLMMCSFHVHFLMSPLDPDRCL